MTDMSEKILNYFISASSCDRIKLVCSLIQLCLPYELRFVGACLEDKGRKDASIELLDEEKRANNTEDVDFKNDVLLFMMLAAYHPSFMFKQRIMLSNMLMDIQRVFLTISYFNPEEVLSCEANVENENDEENVDETDHIADSVSSWLKEVRLHKYSDHLSKYTWHQLLNLKEEDLCMLTVGAKKKLNSKMQIIRNLIHSEQQPNNSSTFVGKSARNFNSQNSKPVEFISPPANTTSLQPELMPVDAVDDQSSSSRPFSSDALSKISHDGSQCIISSSTDYISATTTKNESSASKSVNAIITSSTSFTSLVPTITTSSCVETIPGKQEHSASQLQQITFLLSKERQHCSSEAEAPTSAKYDNVHLVSPAHLSSLESSCSEDYHTPLGSPDAKKTSFYSQGDVNNFNVGNNSVDNVKVIHINGSNKFVKDEHDEDFVFNNCLCKMIDFKNAEKNYEVRSDGNVMKVPAKLLDEHFPKIISQLTSDDKNVLLRPHKYRNTNKKYNGL
ncbi:hypothetical protein HELRODRAFT_165952 [Helobdella robusta]|uniref:RNA-binding protein vts1-like alpha-helical domain-containing protein n=1 Tax=Helobdella robusta TaxID=6412 RepID=T1EXI1_HELRO|nr:hypothetical protein HELRODRAFT_165952 [Helobdella robusta]ESN90303.1 hypothetical protein HELRODRAFT_165952 [Helobdella robusta]